MKRTFFNSILLLLIALLTTPKSYAGIPISESTAKVERIEQMVKGKKSKNKVTALKNQVAEKVLLKRMEGDNKVAAIVFAILIPFVGVAIYQDRIGTDFWITLLLTALLYVPGLIYALSIVLKRTR
jgi:uncharacterized membrane protein YqaE (UPF0057 family)